MTSFLVYIYIYIYIYISHFINISFAKKKIYLFPPIFFTVIYFKDCIGLKNRLHLNENIIYYYFPFIFGVKFNLGISLGD